ncbi:MAG: hypothetical protein FWD71_03015 [Oscillospiraceae bacterium]|nr:hypothetical protein [Oscillospiraceae bacterium]
MPQEYDFMKTKEERGMPEEEYKKVHGEYNQKAEMSGEKVKKTIFISMGIFAVSFVIINLISLFNHDSNFGAGVGNYTWLVVEFIILALFLYDPKAEDDKRYTHETSQKIILKSLQNKIKLNKIRLGCVIGFAVVFLLLNIIAWWMLGINLSNLNLTT